MIIPMFKFQITIIYEKFMLYIYTAEIFSKTMNIEITERASFTLNRGLLNIESDR